MDIKALFIKLFRKSSPSKDYDDKLIIDLKNEHKELLKLYKFIINNYNKKKYKKVLTALNDFEKAYRLHILLEDNRLYTYLEEILKYDQKQLGFVEQKHYEMDNITKALKEFLNKYNSEDKISSNEFKSDLEKIGKVLVDRINFEENELYPLYKEIKK